VKSLRVEPYSNTTNEMSLSSTGNIKSQLGTHLGPKAPQYFATLKLFVTGKSSRSEFEDSIKSLLDAPNLVQLHNALIISLFDATTHKRAPPPVTYSLPKPPPRKRRRILPYQGPTEDKDGALSLHSSRLKRWALAVGKRERERLKSYQTVSADIPRPLRRPPVDEIASERGVVLLPERGDPPGSRLPVHLASISGAPTLQHIADRMNLICAQNNLSAPGRAVPALMNLACEAKLKQLLTHALTLTSTSLTISSITAAPGTSSSHAHTHPLLTTSSFDTLFTISPTDLPNKSAAAMRLAVMGDEDRDGADGHDDVALLKDREVRDQRWQILALLGERSTVREALRGRL